MMERGHKKIIVITALVALLLNYPWLSLFSSERMLLGIPLLYLFLFGVWLALILCVRHYVDSDKAGGSSPPAKTPAGAERRDDAAE